MSYNEICDLFANFIGAKVFIIIFNHGIELF